MILGICRYGNPVLRKKAERVRTFNAGLKQLAQDMIETMLQADGVGLAAPQIGKSIQLIIVDPHPDQGGLTRMVLVNPQIEEAGKETEVMEEGCLSLPGIYARVKRSIQIRVKAQDLDGKEMNFEAQGFLARIIQHEIDHLNGVLFIDKILPREKKRVEKELKEFQKIYA